MLEMMFSLKKSIFYIKALSSSKAFKNTTPFRCFHVLFVLKITFIVLHLNLDRSIILRKSLLFNIYQKNWHNSTQQHQYSRVEFPLKMVKEKKIKDKKFQWKFKLLAEKFTWANNCWVMSTNFWFSKVCWQCPAMFCLHTSSKLSCSWFTFSLKVKVMGSNPGYLLKSFLLQTKETLWK